MAARLTAALGRWEARALPAGATRVGRGGLSALDLVAVPRGESWRPTLLVGRHQMSGDTCPMRDY
eukprot:9213601-Alexandrium_andersonii.AAC.1